MKNDLNANSKTLDDKAFLSDEELENVVGGSGSNGMHANQHNENKIESDAALGIKVEDTIEHHGDFSVGLGNSNFLF